jgi:Tat protein translocase TatB subunit
MFGIGLPELVVIFVVALLVLGPQRLPELARALGRGIRELRNLTEDVRKEIDEEIHRPDRGEDMEKKGHSG